VKPILKDGPSGSDGPAVAQIVRTYLPLSENWIYEQARILERYRSVFASRRIANLHTFPFVPVYSVAQRSLPVRLWERAQRKRKGYSPFFADVCTQEQAVIMHAHGGGIATASVSTARHLGLPLVTSFYGVDMWQHPEGAAGLRRKYADVFAYGTLFLAEGPAAGAQLARIGCPPDRIIVHRLGVDVARIPLRPRSLEDGSALRVLMAARFIEKKGLPYGVEAFSRVAKGHPSMRLTIVGKASAARYRHVAAELQQIARRHGVENQIEMMGFIPREKLRELADQHHILLHPSVQAKSGDAEGGHPVVMTMLAAGGMPILATYHCDIPEVVQDGVTGWLCAERDVDCLEAALRSIVKDPALLQEMGRRARKLVEEKYDIRTNRLDPVYDRVLAGI
jgi:colanic acid/amylovoran biosynthesis glycosyltransferase